MEFPKSYLLNALVLFSFLGSVLGQKDYLTNESKLLRTLLNSSSYDARVRPASNPNDTVNVKLGVSILKINELNEKSEFLDLTVWILFVWTDFRLKWNPDDYGFKMIRIPVKSIWTPDIVPYNNFDADLTVGDTMVVVSFSGVVTWVPPARLRTFCSVDMTNFPFDRQTCTLRLGSWTYSGNLVNLTQARSGVRLSNYNDNKQWNVFGTSANITSKVYPCCPDSPYQVFYVTINLVRRDSYYRYVFVLPAVLVALLVPLQCFIPPDSEEKLSLGGALMISMVLLSSALNDALPSAHLTSPYISTYYSMTMVWIALSMATGILIKCVGNAKYTRREVPNFIRQVLLHFLKKVFCMDEEPLYTPTELEALSMRGIDLRHDINSTAQTKATTQVSGKLEKDVDEILSYVNALTVMQRLRESRIQNWNEWYQLAIACDRLICALYITTVVIYSLAILA